MTRELRQRLVFGPLMAVLAVAALWLDHRLGLPLAMAFLVVLGVGAATIEFARLLGRRGQDVCLPVLLPAVLLCVGSPFLATVLAGWTDLDLPRLLLPALLGLGWTALALVHLLRQGTEGFVAAVSAGGFGLVYLGLLPWFTTALLCLRGPAPDRGPLLFVLAVTACKLGDTMAFTTGRLIGRHKLVPRISPGKTWEGFAGSLVGSVGGTFLALAAFHWLGLGNPFRSWVTPIIWGLVVGPLGVLGDLVESALKRECGAKDSGAWLPGFGGFLDVLDAIILAGVGAFLLAQVL